MSTSSIIGLDGVSKNTACAGVDRAFSHWSRSAPSTNSVVTPYRGRISSRMTKQEPNSDRAATIRSPAFRTGGERVEHRRHPAGGGEAGLGALDQPQPVLEGGDRRIAVARVDETVDVALERGLGAAGDVVDVSRGQVQRLGGLLEVAAVQTAADREGVRSQRRGASRLPPRKSGGLPAVRRRGARTSSRAPSKPSVMLYAGLDAALRWRRWAAAIERSPERHRNSTGPRRR